MGHPRNSDILDEHGTEKLSYMVTLFFISDLSFWFFTFNCLQIFQNIRYFKTLVLCMFKLSEKSSFWGGFSVEFDSTRSSSACVQFRSSLIFPLNVKFLVPDHTTKIQLYQKLFSQSFSLENMYLNGGKEF